MSETIGSSTGADAACVGRLHAAGVADLLNDPDAAVGQGLCHAHQRVSLVLCSLIEHAGRLIDLA